MDKLGFQTLAAHFLNSNLLCSLCLNDSCLKFKHLNNILLESIRKFRKLKFVCHPTCIFKLTNFTTLGENKASEICTETMFFLVFYSLHQWFPTTNLVTISVLQFVLKCSPKNLKSAILKAKN